MNTLPLAPSGVHTIQSPLLKPEETGPTSDGSFADILTSQLNATNAAQQIAAQSIAEVEQGTGEINNAMIDMQKASLMFSTTHAVTQKLISAYSDIMNTQI